MLAGAMAAALVMTALPIHAAEENNTFLQEDEDALRVFSNKEKGTEEGTEETSGNALNIGMWGLRTDNKWFLWDCH